MKIFYDKDAKLSILKKKTIAVIGYGSQGHAHARTCATPASTSIVGLRPGALLEEGRGGGFEVLTVAKAAKAADIIMILLPDELQADVYREEIAGEPETRRHPCFRPRVQHPLRADRRRPRT